MFLEYDRHFSLTVKGDSAIVILLINEIKESNCQVCQVYGLTGAIGPFLSCAVRSLCAVPGVQSHMLPVKLITYIWRLIL